MDGEKGKLDSLVLALDGQVLSGLTAHQSSSSDETSANLLFYLIHTDTNRKDWQKVLARSRLRKPQAMSLAIVEIGTANTYGGPKILFQVASLPLIVVMGGLYALLLLAFGIWVGRGNLLRDVGPPPVGGGKRPFSLAATQMAFWFFLILLGFIYVWILTSSLDSVTASVLGLAGISAGTGLAATAIGSSNIVKTADPRSKLENEAKDLKTKLNEADDKTKERLSEIEVEIEKLSSNSKTEKQRLKLENEAKELKEKQKKAGDETKKSLSKIEDEIAKLPNFIQKFFRDILVSEGQMTFSRFQMFAWTLVLGVIFLHTVFTTLAMPEFSATLLGLMGLSSGTYAGFKFPKAPNV